MYLNLRTQLAAEERAASIHHVQWPVSSAPSQEREGEGGGGGGGGAGGGGSASGGGGGHALGGGESVVRRVRWMQEVIVAGRTARDRRQAMLFLLRMLTYADVC
jgi:hypothetical protein